MNLLSKWHKYQLLFYFSSSPHFVNSAVIKSNFLLYTVVRVVGKTILWPVRKTNEGAKRKPKRYFLKNKNISSNYQQEVKNCRSDTFSNSYSSKTRIFKTKNAAQIKKDDYKMATSSSDSEIYLYFGTKYLRPDIKCLIMNWENAKEYLLQRPLCSIVTQYVLIVP